MIKPPQANPDGALVRPGVTETTLPRAAAASQQNFQSVLRQIASQLDPSNAAAFDRIGVMGRRVVDPSVGVKSLTAFGGAAKSSEAPAPSRAAQAPRVQAQQSAERSTKRQSAAGRTISAQTAQRIEPKGRPAVTAAASYPEAPRKPTSSMNARSVAQTPRVVRETRTQRAPVSVVMHATDTGASVFARAGRMTATARARLRQALRALLTEKGVTTERITLDGESGDAREGETTQWPR